MPNITTTIAGEWVNVNTQETQKGELVFVITGTNAPKLAKFLTHPQYGVKITSLGDGGFTVKETDLHAISPFNRTIQAVRAQLLNVAIQQDYKTPNR